VEKMLFLCLKFRSDIFAISIKEEKTFKSLILAHTIVEVENLFFKFDFRVAWKE